MITTQCCTAQSSFKRLALQTSLPWTSFCGTSSKYSSFSNLLLPIAQIFFALLTRVYPRTWTGSRWMFGNMGWVRRLKACVAAAEGVFFLNSDRGDFTTLPLKHTAQKTLHKTRHSTHHAWHSPQIVTAPQNTDNTW